MINKKVQRKQELRSSPRMAAEDRRQQIIDVAVRLFSQKGFRGTTTKEIALAAGVNESIIFRHFTTKSELYAAIIDQKANPPDGQSLRSVLEEAIATGGDRHVFETIAFNVLEFHDRDDTAMRLLLYSALEGHELADMIFRNHISRLHRRLADYVKERITDGAFRRVEPMAAVRGFMGMIIAHVMHKKFFQQAMDEPLSSNNRQVAGIFADMFLSSMTNHEYETERPRRR